MEIFGYFVGVILPPITISVFAIGMVYRLREWWKLPSPKLTLYPVPAPGLDSFLSILKATFFFPSLFKADRLLWFGAWIFHASLALILVGHIRVATDFPGLWKALGINADTMSSVMGGLAGVVIMLATLILTFRRMGIARVQEITQTGDYVTLILLLAVILTGNAMRFQGHFDLELTRQYFAGLFLLQAPPPPAQGWFLIHFFLGQLMFIYLPFSKLLHFGGIFFTQTALQRR
jgi:nitrate reductase gamma subunit